MGRFWRLVGIGFVIGLGLILVMGLAQRKLPSELPELVGYLFGGGAVGALIGGIVSYFPRKKT